MNRKKTPSQNDISLTISHLPKRLQKKIAEEAAAESFCVNKTDNVTNTKSDVSLNTIHENAGKDTHHDVLSAKSNGHHHASVKTVLERKAIDKPLSTIQNTNKSKSSILMGSEAKNKQNSLECGFHHSPQLQRSGRSSAMELPLTPIRQLQKTTIIHPSWFKTAHLKYSEELPQLYETLISLIHKNAILQNWKTFCNVHLKLQNIFKNLLLSNLKFSCEENIDWFFWKLLFYNVREYIEKQKSLEKESRLLELFDIGLQFYTDLHLEFSNKYFNDNSPNRTNANKLEFIAKVLAQKLLISLGDLHRYKTKHLQTSDYSNASKYYLRAQSLIPTNGRPYNQLAIVAILTRKKFDAVYFHVRSLMSSNQIHSARESLSVLFDEIRKKFEESEMKASPLHNNSKKNNILDSQSLRKEVWVHPNGVRSLHNSNKSTVAEENRFNKMPLDDVYRRFVSVYLYVFGKLFTGIGMESTQQYQKTLFLLFKVLMKRSNLIISRAKMLKLVALNISVMEYNMAKDSRRQIQSHAFNFSNQMFGLVLHQCNQLLLVRQEKSKEFNIETFTDLNTLLQYIKIYTDWLSKNVKIWEPESSAEHNFVNCWFELENLFKQLQNQNLLNGSEEQVVLEEDEFFNGFTPLSDTITTAKDSTGKSSTETEQFNERLRQISKFQQCYIENRKKLEASEMLCFLLGDINQAIESTLYDNKDDDDNSENIVVNGLNRSKPKRDLKSIKLTNGDKTELTKLKELEAQARFRKMHSNNLDKMLNAVDSKVFIEVHPKYLLPDTNCFIDCLDDFELLLQKFKHYTLVIPLTVVKELDGLSKGVKLEAHETQYSRIHHYDDVSTRAMKSLDFIKSAKNNVKCVTTKGSFINASLFALVEEEYVSNDDKILATAIAVSKTMCTESSLDGKCFIQTELVLVTTDRNLRVKAMTRNLAVSSLKEFLHWARESKI